MTTQDMMYILQEKVLDIEYFFAENDRYPEKIEVDSDFISALENVIAYLKADADEKKKNCTNQELMEVARNAVPKEALSYNSIACLQLDNRQVCDVFKAIYNHIMNHSTPVNISYADYAKCLSDRQTTCLRLSVEHAVRGDFPAALHEFLDVIENYNKPKTLIREEAKPLTQYEVVLYTATIDFILKLLDSGQ